MVMDLVGLVWQRPWGAVALALPLAVWLLARRRDGAQTVWTGTLEVWREATPPQPTQARRARRLPPSLRLLVAALAAGALAFAGPRALRAQQPRTWTVVVDRSPSMALPWLAPAGQPDRRGTRLERALERAQELLAQVRSRGDRLVWSTYEDGRPVRVEDDVFPRRWLAAPRIPQAHPPWSSHDAAGMLWVSDAEPAIPAREAGLALSGGAAVPGFVAALGTTRLEWDGQALHERPGAGPRPVVVLEPGFEGPLARVVRAWAQARDCEVVEAGAEQGVLALVQGGDILFAGGGRSGTVRTGRDGWSWRADLTRSLPVAGEVWLTEESSGLPLVSVEPGRIRLPAGRYDREPEGDPADFALSWSTLLDRVALPAAGVVSIEERQAAGTGRSRAPVRAPARAGPGAALALDALLALASAGLALVALLLRRRL